MNNLPSIDDVRLPDIYVNAKSALSECARIDECKDWADKAAALASYARMANDDSLLKHARRIQARAVRRMGELLKQVDPGKGGRPIKNSVAARPSLSGWVPGTDRGVGPPDLDGWIPGTRSELADSVGLTKHRRKVSLRVANVSVLVPTDQLTDTELDAKANEYGRMAEGCRLHALELRRYMMQRAA